MPCFLWGIYSLALRLCSGLSPPFWRKCTNIPMCQNRSTQMVQKSHAQTIIIGFGYFHIRYISKIKSGSIETNYSQKIRLVNPLHSRHLSNVNFAAPMSHFKFCCTYVFIYFQFFATELYSSLLHNL